MAAPVTFVIHTVGTHGLLPTIMRAFHMEKEYVLVSNIVVR
jgi:hypothetical protein